MADETEQTDTDSKLGSREHHAPQPASAKHERLPGKEGSAVEPDAVPPALGDNGQRRGLRHWITSHRKVSVPLFVVFVLAILAAVPYTRYVLAGMVLNKDFLVQVTDSQTNKPVSSASVTLAGKTVLTNNLGIARLHVRVGSAKIDISKKYYQSISKNVLVPIGSQKPLEEVSLVATGRQVPIVVTDKISGQPVANATVSARGTEAKTDTTGQVTMVLPADTVTVSATVSGSGYNTATVTIKVTAAVDPANTFQITPSGKLYFVSNLSGTIDVVKTNLDGTGRQTVLVGTGQENKVNTVLLASQDWRYLALLSKRDGNEKLYLINTADDSLTTIDDSDYTFTMVGWSGHSFIYTATSNTIVNTWQPNRQVLKAYDAPSGKTTTLDQTAAGGTLTASFDESLGSVYILNNEIVYAKDVSATTSNDINGHQATINSVKADGTERHAVKGWSLNASSPTAVIVTVQTTPYGPNDMYVAVGANVGQGIDTNLYDYYGGQLQVVPGKTASNIYDTQYSTYLLSPSNALTFWDEPRDGKNTLFVGNADGKNGKQIATLSDYVPYGWYTEKYLFVSKNGSELYIMPVGGGTPVKVTDYYKPSVSFTGYGHGYGGL
jgi:hypothetical protein